MDDAIEVERAKLRKLIVEAVGRYLHTNHGEEAEMIADWVLEHLVVSQFEFLRRKV